MKFIKCKKCGKRYLDNQHVADYRLHSKDDHPEEVVHKSEHNGMCNNCNWVEWCDKNEERRGSDDK